MEILRIKECVLRVSNGSLQLSSKDALKLFFEDFGVSSTSRTLVKFLNFFKQTEFY